MKKTLAMLLVLALVAPAMAVTFTASDAGSGVLKIDYTLASGEVLRGLALKLTRTSGDAVVAAGTDVTVAPFNTFIDFAFSNAGYQIGQGHPVANPAAAGVATLPASTFSISVGYLDQGGNQAGITTNGSITVKLTGTANSCFDIEMDTLRGGVVGDNVVAPAAGWKINQCVVLVTDCYTGPDFAQWTLVGKPQSWCTPTQCHGDANNAVETIGKGSFRVGYADLSILVAGFSKAYVDPVTSPWIAADFNHAPETIGKGSFRVGYADLNILVNYFAKTGVPTDCLTASPVKP